MWFWWWIPYHPAFGWDRVNCRRKLGGETARTANPNQLKGYSVPYDAMPSIWGVVGFWRMHIPYYSQIVSSLHHVTWKNDFKWGPEQWQAFEQIKWEIVHAVTLGPVQSGQDIKNVLYTTARENGLTWSLWQKAAGDTQGRSLGLGVRDTENPRPAKLQLKKRYWQLTQAFNLLQKWLALKHSSS